jgi:hypothetical protein
MNVKRHAVEFIRKMESAEYTRTVLRNLHSELQIFLQQLGEGGGRDDLLKLLDQLDSQLDIECAEH